MQKLGKPETEFQKWFYKNLGENSLSLVDVAERLHCTRQAISNHYRNETAISYVWVLGYCKVFNYDNPDEIYILIRKGS